MTPLQPRPPPLPPASGEEQGLFGERSGKSPLLRAIPPAFAASLLPIPTPFPAPPMSKVTFSWLRLSEEKSRAHSV